MERETADSLRGRRRCLTRGPERNGGEPHSLPPFRNMDGRGRLFCGSIFREKTARTSTKFGDMRFLRYAAKYAMVYGPFGDAADYGPAEFGRDRRSKLKSDDPATARGRRLKEIKEKKFAAGYRKKKKRAHGALVDGLKPGGLGRIWMWNSRLGCAGGDAVDCSGGGLTAV